MSSHLPRRASVWPAVWAVVIVALVLGSGVAVWRMTGSGGAMTATAPPPATAPARLVRGNDYYLYIKLIELADRAPSGAVWDRLDKSGPDIGFRLTWHQNVIWTSVVKKDTLIGSWDLMKIDLKQIAISGGQADLEGALNAPLVHYEPGETVELNVWDADPVGAYDDAGTVVIHLDQLGPGETTLRPSGEKFKAVRRVVLSLIDRHTSVPDLIQTMSNR